MAVWKVFVVEYRLGGTVHEEMEVGAYSQREAKIRTVQLLVQDGVPHSQISHVRILQNFSEDDRPSPKDHQEQLADGGDQTDR